jgi:acetylcholinesterase
VQPSCLKAFQIANHDAAHGAVNASVPGVRHWLGIPFAQTPIGPLRFALPQPLPANASSVNLQNQYFGPNCPQYEATTPSVYTLFRREYFINGANGDDCLTVSIWAPETPINESLPVFIWVYGGGDTTGGSSVPYQNPQRWVARTQAHIVVSLQYRLNFFGQPNTPFQNQNLATFDARLAVEWVRDNIAAFGGDPKKMVLWGQSAGGGVVDNLSIGWPDDPIVTGFIQDSGSSWDVRSPYVDSTFTNFTFIAEQFGCTGSAQNQSTCLSTIHEQDLESLIQFWVDAGKTPPLKFQWKGDNNTNWNNYTQAYAENHVSPLPKIILHNLVS